MKQVQCRWCDGSSFIDCYASELPSSREKFEVFLQRTAQISLMITMSSLISYKFSLTNSTF